MSSASTTTTFLDSALTGHRLRAVLALVCAIAFHLRSSGNEVPRRERTYDVLHYQLKLTLDERERSVTGTASITITPLLAPLDSVVLDAESLKIRSVVLSAKAVRFGNDSHELIAHLAGPVRVGDTLTLDIEYTCTPLKGLYFIQPDSTDPTRRHQIWTQGEEEDNRYWFPCYDFPDDKATSEVIATVPERYVLVSNGALESAAHNQDMRTRTFHWRQSKPHASYLIMLAAGEYEVLHEPGSAVPMQYYVYKEYAADARRTFGKTPAMMKFMEDRIGFPYPWEKFAQVFVNQFPLGGMENTSVVALNEIYMLDARAAVDFTSDDVIAHELAHQWWGNVVTCKDWTHLWLNEGFASFFGSLYTAFDKGNDEYQYGRMQDANAVLQTEQYLGRKPVVSNESHAVNVYKKGAWVLFMLRTLIGEDAFWKTVHLYMQRHAFANADTRDLQSAAEEVTGRRLAWFFDRWLYKAGHPELSVRTVWDTSRKSLGLTISQDQQQDSLTDLFSFPLDIEFTTRKEKKVQTIWISRQTEALDIPLDEKPLMVIVDKGMKILKALTFEKSVEEYIYQLAHAEDVSDRVVAARELRRYKEDHDAFSALRQSALGDPFWAVRMEATISLGLMMHDEVKDALFAIYRDRHSRVRQAAIVGLEQFATGEVRHFIERAAETDSSYLVLGSCITAMQEVDSGRAFDFAQKYVSMDSYRDIVRRSALAVLRNLGDPRGIPVAIEYTAPGNPADIRSLATGVLGTSGSDNERARWTMRQLVKDADSSVRVAAVRGLATWGDREAQALLEKQKAEEKDEDVAKAIEDALEMISTSPAKAR